MLDRKINKRSISPVIGVVLMVALVVALAALVSVSVFILQDESGDESAEASVDISETTSGIKATVVRNENVEDFIVQSPSGTKELINETGETATVEDGTGLYSVIAVFPSGSEQVIDTVRLTEDDIGGLFTVNQDEDQKEADATVEEDYDSTSNYEITVVTEEEQNDSSTVFYKEVNDGDKRLLSNPAERDGRLLQQGIKVGQKLDISKKGILDIADVSPNPGSSSFGIGEPVQLHKMTNLCKGDEVHLVDQDTQEVISKGEEIKFDMPDCDQMRRVAEYQGGEIVAVELINLWNQDLDYAVFDFNGDVPPPTRPTPEGDDVSVTINVEESGSGKQIEDASVILGDVEKQTDIQGKAVFDIGNADKTLFATASKSGYYSSQVPVDLSSISSGGSKTKTIVLPNRTEQSFSVPSTGSGDSPIGTVTSGDSVTVETSPDSSGAVVSGGTGGSPSISSDSVSSGGSVYSGSSLSSTTTLSSPTVPDEEVVDENTNSDPLVDIVQPDRQFNTVPVDQDLIPTGSEGEFKVRTSIRALEDTNNQIEDTVKVKAIRESDGKEVKLEGVGGDNQNKTVFLTSGETEVVEQTLYFPNGTISGDKNQEFSILVTLDSTTEVKSAGSLEVFNGSSLQASILGGTVSPNNPKISEGGSQQVTVSVDHSKIDATNPVTIDLFQNGQRIDSKEVGSPDSSGSVDFTTTVDELGYYEYHVGIQESQSVALADSILVSPETSADISINPQLQIKGSNTSCTPFTDLGGQFDCEIEVGESVHLDGNIEIKGADASDYKNVEIIWTWKEVDKGQESAYDGQTHDAKIDWGSDLTSYDPANYDQTITGFSQDTVQLNKSDVQYNNSDVYLAELRIRGEDSNGNQIGGQADATINVAQDPDNTTSRFVTSGAFNEDTARLVLESTRATSSEDVRIDYVHNNTVQNSRNATVPRQGGQIEVLEDLVLSNYQNDSATVGEDITVDVELYAQDDERSSNDPVDTDQITFEVIPEVVVDANIRPIACKDSSDTDTILKTLGNVTDWSSFDSFDDKQDAESTFATPLDQVKVIDPNYWTGTGLDKSSIESDTSCVVAG